MRKRFILVAGNPRSGTTFVGKMLALNKSVQYLDEPFNAEFGMLGVKSYFPYVNQTNPDELSLHNKKLVDDFFNRKAEFRKLDPKTSTNKKQYLGRKLFGTKNNYQYKNLFYNPAIKTGIIKDPTASLLSLYMAQEYNIPVLVVIRHPLATMASFKRLNMIHDIKHLHLQPDLAKNYLLPITKSLNLNKLSPLQHNSYHWLIIHSILADFAKNNKNFKVITHEQISEDPINEFKKLYKEYGLKFTKNVIGKIQDYTAANNPSAAPNNQMHHLKRNSKQTTKEWKNILTKKEIQTIKSITKNFATQYYPKETWN